MGWIRRRPTGGVLNVVVSGNSVMRGEGASAGHQPSDKIAALLTAASRTFTIINAAVNGEDINYYIANFSGQVHANFNPTRGVRNVAVLLETSDYVDDTLGSGGAGDTGNGYAQGLALSNSAAGGQANYDRHVVWAQLASSLGWLPIVVCAPDVVEPAAYAGAPTGATDNTTYRTARDHSYDLMRANVAAARSYFYAVADARVRSEFSNPWSLTYYVNAGDGERIHLTDAGYDLLGTVVYGVLP